MEIQPILASLRRHKIPSALIILEVALACAIFSNAISAVAQRVQTFALPNAIEEKSLLDVSVRGANPNSVAADMPRNMDALRRITDVSAAAAMSSLPFGPGGVVDSVCPNPDGQACQGSGRYMFTSGGAEVLGLQLVSGRLFSAADYPPAQTEDSALPAAKVVIVTESLASRLWPRANAVGREVWLGNGKHHYMVVGVVRDVVRPGSVGLAARDTYFSTFYPSGPSALLENYVIRTNHPSQGRVLLNAISKLASLSPDAVVKGETFSDIRDTSFAGPRSMIWVLILVCTIMLSVTAFTIMGLTGFWVGQRRRQIGIRRALGATRRHVLTYFQLENLLLVSIGIAVGSLASYAVNLYLMKHYQTSRLPWTYIPVSAVVLWLLGQLAVLEPALKAANVPPIEATRNL